MRTLLGAVALAAGLYAALLVLLWWGQERLLFMPTPLPADHRFDLGADVVERTIEVPGARLSALHLQRPAPKAVVLYLHGNAGNLDSWFANADFWRRANVELLMIDYRGYGKSSGRIRSLAELEADVRAAWATLAPRAAGRKVVLFGRSLGSGLAAGLAAELQPDLTVLVSPYRSLQALAAEHYPWVPSALLRYPLDTESALARVKTPLLLAHGGRDDIIPASHSMALARVAPHARLLLVPAAGHNDIHEFPAYLDGLRAALDAL